MSGRNCHDFILTIYVHRQFMKVIERFEQLVEQHYKELVNGLFEDCTKEVS